nr:copia protein [Tanacetum cinerariifolium]
VGIKNNVVDKNIVYGCVDDPNMPNLEEIVYSDDDEDVGAEADMTNLDTTIPVSSIPTTRIHKDHPDKQIIRDIHLAPQTRRMTKSILVDLPYGKRAIGTKWIYRIMKDEGGIVVRNKARLVAHGYTQEEEIDYDEIFAPVAKIEAIILFLAYASFKDFIVYQMQVKSAFMYGKIEHKVHVYQPLGFEDLEFPDRVYKGINLMVVQVKLEEEEKKDTEDPRNKDNEGLSIEEPRVNQEKDVNVNITNNNNTVSPTANVVGIKNNFWATATAKNINRVAHIHAKVDGKKVVIFKAIIRRDLKFEDEGGVDCLSNEVIFEQLPLIGYENLSQKLTFYKEFFS